MISIVAHKSFALVISNKPKSFKITAPQQTTKYYGISPDVTDFVDISTAS